MISQLLHELLLYSCEEPELFVKHVFFWNTSLDRWKVKHHKKYNFSNEMTTKNVYILQNYSKTVRGH